MRALVADPPVDTMNNREFAPNGTAEADARSLSEKLHARRGKTYEQIEQAFTAYLHDVKELGIVSALLVGSKAHGPGAYLWNVFAKDYCVEEWAAPEFVALNQLTYRLEQGLPRNRSLYIAHLNPSDVAEIRTDCAQQEIETVLVPVR